MLSSPQRQQRTKGETLMKIRFLSLAVMMLFSAAILLGQSTGCGYALVGHGSFLPDHIKTIGVPMFKNKTRKFRLDQIFTNHVINELITRGDFEVVPEETGVDAVLIGEITSYYAVPTSFSEPGQATSYEVFVRVKVALADLVDNRILYENKYFEFSDSYNFPDDANITFSPREAESLEELAEDFAESLVTAVLEGF
jgi:hypothetical protein